MIDASEEESVPVTDSPRDSATNEIAVTVIGGYLGAGKTTLVNHILRSAQERIAVLVNDFGTINIDEELIESSDGDTISLANGCICCSLVDGLAAALNTVQEFEPRPERLVIEASGVADPTTVAAYGHGPGLVLDAVVVLVDGETIEQRANDKYVGDTVRAQLQAADVAVLNKIDLLGAEEVDAVQAWLGNQCPEALIVRAEQSLVPGTILFGRPSRDSGGSRDIGGTTADGTVDAVIDSAHHHGSGVDEIFESWTWTGVEPIERSVIEQTMDELPDEVVRAKGLLRIADRPDRVMALQRVGRRWTLRPTAAGTPGASAATSTLVLIGTRGAVHDRWLADRLDP